MRSRDFNFDLLKGSTITSIEGVEEGSGEINISLTDGRNFVMYHEQHCCEDVGVYDVAGDVANVVNLPLTLSEYQVLDDRPDDAPVGKDDYIESETWSVFRLGTEKGTLTIRWCGSSNGYYSESVSFVEES